VLLLYSPFITLNLYLQSIQELIQSFVNIIFTNVVSVLKLLHCVDLSNVSSTSAVHAASIFRIEMCRLVSLMYIQHYVLKRTGRRYGR
jgi:hypothetical protein